ncbi:ubiquinol oxidase subunit II [Rhodanobacter sp. BL-MT-08]
MPLKNYLRGLLLLPVLALLAGCNAVLLHPDGDVALQQRDLILISLGLMLLIVIPVIVLTLVFAWRYRARNRDAEYDPEWHHSTMLELVVWSAPLLIIIALGALTWVSTHKLDPYRSLDRLSATKPVAADVKPLTVEVVALDWKWLFFYPEQGIATVNELAAPIDRPIRFKITASTVMNSFFIPSLAGQVYAMPGMETKLSAVINKVGVYDGFSANFSGDGFSGMRFKFHGMSDKDFDAWVANARKSVDSLDRDTYLRLAEPSELEPVHFYSSVDAHLYDAIMMNCVAPGQSCANNMMGEASHGASHEVSGAESGAAHAGAGAGGHDDSMKGMDMSGMQMPATDAKNTPVAAPAGSPR